jgi:sulfur-carrier protein
VAVLQVELCGRLADLAGDVVDVDVPNAGVTIANLRATLAAAYPAFAEAILGPKTRACVDEILVDDAAMVRAGQVVAFFPPLSGG